MLGQGVINCFRTFTSSLYEFTAYRIFHLVYFSYSENSAAKILPPISLSPQTPGFEGQIEIQCEGNSSKKIPLVLGIRGLIEDGGVGLFPAFSLATGVPDSD